MPTTRAQIKTGKSELVPGLVEKKRTRKPKAAGSSTVSKKGQSKGPKKVTCLLRPFEREPQKVPLQRLQF